MSVDDVNRMIGRNGFAGTWDEAIAKREIREVPQESFKKLGFAWPVAISSAVYKDVVQSNVFVVEAFLLLWILVECARAITGMSELDNGYNVTFTARHPIDEKDVTIRAVAHWRDAEAGEDPVIVISYPYRHTNPVSNNEQELSDA